ncbi:MAG: AAA family ATPase [bacterium]|nr:AAA family ATPase [bacterium]
MYAAHFGLRESPFNNTPDPRFFFATPDHEEALASLVYTVEELKGFALLTGEVGVGKTLVSRMMLRHFGGRIDSATISNTALCADDLLAAICAEFEVTTPLQASRFQMVRALQDFLLAQFAANRPVVLVLDEAQNLPHEAFEQIRMIGNLEADDAKLLQIVIVGQPELRDRFASPNMRQLRQRVFRGFHLPAMKGDLCARYIAHRLGVAGLKATETSARSRASGATPIFDAAAIDAIQQFSQGLPRPINTACDNALLSAYAAGRKRIDGPFMKDVIAQLAGDAGNARPAADRVARTAVVGNAVEGVDASALQGLEDRLARLETRMTGIARRTRRLMSISDRRDSPIQPGPPVPIEQPPASPESDHAAPITTGMNPSQRPELERRLACLVARAQTLVARDRLGGAGTSTAPTERPHLQDASGVGADQMVQGIEGTTGRVPPAPIRGPDDRTALRFCGPSTNRGPSGAPADQAADASSVGCPTAALARDVGELAGVIEMQY